MVFFFCSFGWGNERWILITLIYKQTDRVALLQCLWVCSENLYYMAAEKWSNRALKVVANIKIEFLIINLWHSSRLTDSVYNDKKIFCQWFFYEKISKEFVFI